MTNFTNLLPAAPYKGLEGKPILAEALIDFSKFNVASGDSIDVLRIPQGAVVTNAGLVVHTTQATVTLAVGDAGSATRFLAATTLTSVKADNNAGTVDGAVMASDTSTAYQKFYGAEGALRLTVGGADATSAIVTAFVEYFVIAASRELKND